MRLTRRGERLALLVASALAFLLGFLSGPYALVIR